LFDESTGTLTGTPVSDNIGDYPDLVISVSDGKLSDELVPFSITVMPKVLGKADIETQGDVFQTANGYQSVGTLIIDAGEIEQEFANSDLVLEFDEEGNLIDLFGETDLPPELSKYVSTNAGVRAVVGMMTGAEINADEDFGITLMEDTNYFVYYIGVSFDVTIGDRQDPDNKTFVTIETPLNGETIMIADPTDSFLYKFNGTPAGDYGQGESDHGLIPFYPQLNFAELDAFNGYTIEKGAMGIGIKLVDVFEISGTRVTKQAQFADIDWNNAFNSEIEYKAGMNGNLDFAFSIAGFGLLTFELAEASATLDVGFDRQHLAMSLSIAPERPMMPLAYYLVASTEITGTAFVDGGGDYGFELAGTWATEFPQASIGGLMSVQNGKVTLEGTTAGEGEGLKVGLEFFNDTTVGRVEFPESFSAGITGMVTEALDRALDGIETALADLEQAVSDYEFEASLRGLRTALPAIADAATRAANAVPANARSDAKSKTLSYLQNTCKTYKIKAPITGTVIGEKTVCLDDLVDENDIATKAGNSAYSVASSAIVGPKAAMAEMKKRVLEADDESLRQALKIALDRAYDNRSVRVTVSITKKFGFPFNKTLTLYSRDSNFTVLDTATANQIKEAANNVHLIAATSNIMISSQQIFDQLPTKEVIASVREDVTNGVANIPLVEGLGYRAIGDRYEAFVTIDGKDRNIEINVLKPSEVREGVGDMLADLLLSDAG